MTLGRRNFKRSHVIVGVATVVVLVFGAIRLGGTLFREVDSADVQGIGTNSYLQLGGQNKNLKQTSPRPLRLANETAQLPIAAAKAGHYHTLLLTTDGDVYALGNNEMRAVSSSNKPLIGTATKVTFPGLRNTERITAIDASRDHNIALTSAGRVYTWGNNYTGQLGDNTNTKRGIPVLVRGLPAVTQVAAGYRHSAVISQSGDVYAWGGVCTTENAPKAQQLVAQAASNIAALGGYGSANQADLQSNDIGDCATLGSTFVQSKTPKKLTGMSGDAAQLSAGYGHLLVLNTDGRIYSAGCNTFGQLGRQKATDANKNNLNAVELEGKVKSLAAGYRHSAVVLENGRAWQWGYNGHGLSLQVGDQAQPIKTPLQVKTQAKFVSIEAAHDTTFGVAETDEILGWGQDDAQAFWPLKTIDSIKTIGAAKDKQITVSSGMQHALIVAKEK